MADVSHTTASRENQIGIVDWDASVVFGVVSPADYLS